MQQEEEEEDVVLPDFNDTSFVVYRSEYATFFLAMVLYVADKYDLGRQTLKKVATFVYDRQLLNGGSMAETLLDYKRRSGMFPTCKEATGRLRPDEAHAVLDKHLEESKDMRSTLYDIYLTISGNDGLVTKETLEDVAKDRYDPKRDVVSDLRYYLSMAAIHIGKQTISNIIGQLLLKITDGEFAQRLYAIMYESTQNEDDYTVFEKGLEPERYERPLMNRDILLRDAERKLLAVGEDWLLQQPTISWSKSMSWILEGQDDITDCDGYLFNYYQGCIVEAMKRKDTYYYETAFKSMSVMEGDVTRERPIHYNVVKQFTFLLHLIQCTVMSTDKETATDLLVNVVGPYTKAYLNGYNPKMRIRHEWLNFLFPGNYNRDKIIQKDPPAEPQSPKPIHHHTPPSFPPAPRKQIHPKVVKDYTTLGTEMRLLLEFIPEILAKVKYEILVGCGIL
jgi:hypothetical protein